MNWKTEPYLYEVEDNSEVDTALNAILRVMGTSLEERSAGERLRLQREMAVIISRAYTEGCSYAITNRSVLR
jgi:hypothetical protein